VLLLELQILAAVVVVVLIMPVQTVVQV